ncbi:MAG: hypothetical protein CSA55_00275 [Ilumatobacter coccineus]|uniref:Cytochrome c domain-containing protein n=1 Tax=Ilumatobacter coccineus TaxID=467094 RepID=A0A2G6KGD3_9ACTN|nr:MAG: hypothetical protein CSA55_00275 [Ilumatobacter coccineus]
MTMARWRAALLTMIVILLMPLRAAAGAPNDDKVYGLFFYSPTCPHCHDVITNDWPGIAGEFGDDLVVLFVDVTTEGGQALIQQTVREMEIEATGVPMLIIGETVLVGAIQIPEQTPDLVRKGLAEGGIGYPPVTGIEAVFGDTLERESTTTTVPDDGANDEAPATTAAGPAAQTDTEGTTSAPDTSKKGFLERYGNDPVANTLALIVLAALVISLIAVAMAVVKGTWPPAVPSFRGLAVTATSVLGTVIGLILIPASRDEPITLVLSAALVIAFGLIAWLAFSRRRLTMSHWVTPLALVAGLGAAAYLAWVESGTDAAACGLVGDCNLVQQSSYATIGGVSIGIIGVIGYVIMLALWTGYRLTHQLQFSVALWVMVIGGVAFSTYLTFLEPFVIGATCLWCLSSAAVMLMLVWLAWPSVETELPTAN